MSTTEKTEQLFKSFASTKVLVIGDVMLDTYIWGSVERISPEAPVPIVSVEKRENRLGGAANVALNLKSLGAEPLLCSVISDDDRGTDFINLLNESGLSKKGILKRKTRKTTTKFRIIGNNSQLLRVDDEITDNLTPEELSGLKKKLNQLFDTENINVVIFQDYDKGVINKDLIDYTVSLAAKRNISVVVDPKKKNFSDYNNVTLFKPNLKELQEGLNLAPIDVSDMSKVESAVRLLQDKINAEIILSTLSEGGVFVRWKDKDIYKTSHHKAHVRNIADVSGAGDTVISVAALCLANKLSPDVTAAIANLAGGLVCEEVGVVPVDKQRLEKEIMNANILE